MTFSNVRTVNTSSGNRVSSVYGAAVNNALLDPLQGYDADVWAIDQATGNYTLVGRFTSIQVTIRNATEPYMEFNQRIPRYLDGEMQIGWVLERGMVDTRILQQTFGISALSRELRLNRMPRLQITFEINAQELDKTPTGAGGSYTTATGTYGNGELLISEPREGFGLQRKASGQLMLTYCKIDSLTIGAMAGRSVIANRWEGLAEGIEEVDRTSIWGGAALRSVAGPQALNPNNVTREGELGRPANINV
jgi:hypothetical protein